LRMRLSAALFSSLSASYSCSSTHHNSTHVIHTALSCILLPCQAHTSGSPTAPQRHRLAPECLHALLAFTAGSCSASWKG
jgi:hypothetical protein